jgi:hypothetical protein
MRLFVRSWEYSHRRLLLRLRLGVAVFFCAFAILLFAYGSWWGLLVLAGAAAALLGGYFIYHATETGVRTDANQ